MTETIRPSTREALVAGAQDALAESGTTVSVLAIAKRAGVGVGSFYNHFPSKEALFREAAQGALADFEADLQARTAHLDDPVELLCTRIRLYCRMSDTHEQIAWILVHSAPELLAHPTGYSDQAARDVQAAVDAGRMTCDDIPLRLMTVTAGAERLISQRLLDPSIPETRADDFAAAALEFLGLPRAEARALVAVPLADLLATSARER